ncbi:TD and POZ domain-containing protein 1-like [Argiope bruennichi]|uniref:Speckle-type POZ protein like n=1 Tax=Argiope bruennichi TaxID=94029 RepID=A0A8T0EP94_ARGBR|nr:TD and POZ domain-containing protein 1-like [Argiope bruennichi]XP_055946399.1 TD and POZ domain-containing protein 1-like [Argiope bruennichi]KAF8777722.1 Speckle-type POZ protein like [Argiope bruennichi]
MDNGSKYYTFTWFIENYSYCLLKIGQRLISPEFTTDGLESTVWTLRLYPRGYKDNDKNYISLFLNRSKDDVSPTEISAKYELSILASGRSAICYEKNESAFTKGIGRGLVRFVKMQEVLLHRKADYLPDDTLRVRCKIWKKEGKFQPITDIYARTRIGTEHVSFLQVVEDFSTLKPNEKKTSQYKSLSQNGGSLSCSFYFTDASCCDGTIMMEITPSCKTHILTKCKVFLMDHTGKIIKCGFSDVRFNAIKTEMDKLALIITRGKLLNNKTEYLPDDKLTLLCECIFYTGVDYEKIERILQEMPFGVFSQINDSHQNNEPCSGALDDITEIYNNHLLSDVELKTKTESFPAHKVVLCARSSVFKAMLTNDMKETNTNIIQVDDLENDTVHQFLLFLYSDSIESLQWNSAVKLYYAADKYQVEKLKMICSSFLVNNLSISKASELLLLADTHSDSDLKAVAEDFILENDEQVFSTDEWGDLMETNLLLASKTMRLKYIRKL